MRRPGPRRRPRRDDRRPGVLTGTLGDLMTERAVARRDALSPLRWHPVQRRFHESRARFKACCAGRRSGKSDIARRDLAEEMMRAHLTMPEVPDPRYVITCPTRDQVKRLHWEQLKRLLPDSTRAYTSESELRIVLLNGAQCRLVGLDVYQRAEGEPIDYALLDEIADTKEDAWRLTIRPSLGTPGRPPGRAVFIGKPRGRNHWWRIWTDAANTEDWEQFHWSAEDILDPAEVESLRRDLDPLSYDQEVRANFVNFKGRAYYAFDREVQAAHRLAYDPRMALDLCFDFNVDPGVCAVVQSQRWEARTDFPVSHALGFPVRPYIHGEVYACVGEVRIKGGSNTLRVCKRVADEWGPRHRGRVRLYGDATGGQRRSSALAGSDWDIVRRELSKVPGWRLSSHVQSANPPERDRVNAVNSRLMSTDGMVRLVIDPVACPYVVQDLEAVTLKDDGSGDLDKSDGDLTHLSDGLGYRVWKAAPVRSRRGITVEQA